MTRRFSLLLTLVLAVSSLAPAMAGDGDKPAMTVDKLLGEMEAARKTLKSFKADVAKLRIIEMLDDEEKFKGLIEFKMPRLLHMELKGEPNKKGKQKVLIYYITPKGMAWVYRPNNKHAQGAQLNNLDKKKRRGHPLEYGLAGDVRELKRTYVLTILKTEKVAGVDAVAMQMRPRGAARDELDGTVVLWISTTTWLPIQIKEYKNQGDIIEIHTFHNMKINVDLPNKLFEFEPGDDVDQEILPVD